MLPKINNCYDGKTVKNSCFGYNVWKRCRAKRVTFLVFFFIIPIIYTMLKLFIIPFTLNKINLPYKISRNLLILPDYRL